MGAVYNTEFTIKTKEGAEDKIFNRLNQFIEAEDGNSVDFNISKIKANGNNMETYLDLLKLFFLLAQIQQKILLLKATDAYHIIMTFAQHMDGLEL